MRAKQRRSRGAADPQVQVAPAFEAEWPGPSALATACVLNLGWLCQRFTASVEALVRRHGIPSAAAFNVLTILDGAGEPLPPSTIAARMIVSRGTTTGILDSLERRGLVRRTPHGEDRRMRLVAPTPAGTARARRIRAQLHEAERRWLACFTPPQQRQLLRLVAALQAHVPADDDGPGDSP